MDQQQNLHQFREQYTNFSRRLLDDLGLGDLGQPARGQLLASIETYVQQVMLNTLLERVEEKELVEADKLLEQGNPPEDVIAYLLLATPNIDINMADALLSAYATMKNEAESLATAYTKAHARASEKTSS